MNWIKRIKDAKDFERELWKAFREILGRLPKRTKDVLSVSTGEGVWDYFTLKQFKCNVVATDIIDNPLSPKSEKEMKKNGSWKFVKVKPEKKLPFKSDQFDLVYHMDVVEHTPKPYLFLSEQLRVLKKGGTLILSTPNVFRPFNILRAVLGKLYFPRKLGDMEGIGECVHQQEFSEWQLKVLLEEVGFVDVKIYPLLFCFVSTEIILNKRPVSGPPRSLCHYLMVEAKKG